jgi:hypothetical protein
MLASNDIHDAKKMRTEQSPATNVNRALSPIAAVSVLDMSWTVSSTRIRGSSNVVRRPFFTRCRRTHHHQHHHESAHGFQAAASLPRYLSRALGVCLHDDVHLLLGHAKAGIIR